MSKAKVCLVLFVVCLIGATPSAWAAGGRQAFELTRDARLVDAFDRGSAGKVTICHHPPGNPENAQTITVGEAAVAAHLAHGDYLGECHPGCGGVTCTASDQCHDIGVCDPATGTCSNPNAADGTACDDGNPATTDDQCTNGVCGGTVVCAGAPSPVPKTGQTGCWDQYGSPIDCAGTGQDGALQKGVSVDPRFTDNGDGTVTDNLTGLIWLKDANCFGFRNWTTALNDANTLASGYCGLTDGSVAGDWRLPNIKELLSLIDYGQDNPALPPGHPFAGVQPYNLYWSSTSDGAPSPVFAWSVSLFNGDVYTEGKYYSYRVWPVRGGQ